MSNLDRQLPMNADLYCELLLAEDTHAIGWKSYLPGLSVVAVAALAALWLSESFGSPAILMGLLIGLALNFVNAEKRLSPGLNFSSQTLLRIGIVLIGCRITFAEIVSLGIASFFALIAIMVVVIMTGLFTARLFKQDAMFGLLVGGATAICGASAALALWSIIGKDRLDQSRFTAVLLGIAIASAVGMTFYPSIATMLELSDKQAGFLIGASIHDVAQAIGGGFSFSDKAGEVATVVKLSRVTLLAPILILVAFALQRLNQVNTKSVSQLISVRQALPWFVLGFILLVVVNSLFALPELAIRIANEIANVLLLFAVTAAAVKSNTTELLSHGWRSFGPVLTTTFVAFTLSLIVVYFF